MTEFLVIHKQNEQHKNFCLKFHNLNLKKKFADAIIKISWNRNLTNMCLIELVILALY